MSDTYSILHYAGMHADRGRVEPYLRAVRRAVKPDSIVLEIGTGTGLVACAAARAGARRVIAVEPNRVIELAKQIATDNGLGDRIEFVRGLSHDLELDEPADIIVSDLRGATPFHPGHIDAIVDARARLLANGGRIIAARDELYAAPVDVPQAYASRISFCDDDELDVSALREILTNQFFHHLVTGEELVAEPAELTTLDYATVTDNSLDSSVEFTALRTATVHGIAVWFVTDLDGRETISTGPDEKLLAYGRPVFPADQPFEVQAGEKIKLRFRAHPVGGGYVMSWSGGVDADRSFDQSTLAGLTFDRHRRELLRSDATPRAAPRSAALATLLHAMNGERTSEELVVLVRREHPGVFGRDERSARAWISEMIATHGS